MDKFEIGNAAGEIWRLLDKNGDLCVKEIRKKLKMSEPLMYLAIGWLCRENKIHCIEQDEKCICSKNVPGAFFG